MKKTIPILVTLLIAATTIFSQSKLGGKVYFNYSYNKNAVPTNLFEIHRVYFTLKNNLSKDISYKVTTDVGRFNTGKDNRLSVYLKNALLAWKTDFGKFVFGLQGMNLFNVEEHNWGYRFVEKSPMDRHKFSSSADLGIGYYNKFADKLSFSFLITNGSGYKKSENDNYKKYSVQVLYGKSKISKGGFNIGASFSLEPFDYKKGTSTSTENKTVFGGFAGYSKNNLRFGAEYDIFTEKGVNLTKTIMSAYGNYKFTKKVELYARLDLYDPNTSLDNDGDTYIIGGLNFTPGKGLSISPNFRYLKPQTGTSASVYGVNFQFKI